MGETTHLKDMTLMDTNYDMLIVANPFLDRFATVTPSFLAEHHLQEGSVEIADKQTVDAIWKAAFGASELQLGGSGTHVFDALTQFGNKCALLGRAGSNFDISEHLKLGASLLQKGTEGTGIVNCFVTPQDRTMCTYVGCSQELCPEDIQPRFFEGVKWVHIEGYILHAKQGKEAFEKVVESAKNVGAKLSIDLGSELAVELFRETFQKHLSDCHVVCGDKQSMFKLTNQKTLKEAVESFNMNQISVATDGAEGCWVKWEKEEIGVHHEAPKVDQVRDRTGAGDFFLAGLLDGIYSQKGQEECVRRAKESAACVIQQEGADLKQEVWKTLVDAVRKNL